MVLDCGNHSYHDFRQWSNSPTSPCYSLMIETQEKRPKAHIPRWIWHVAPMKAWKRYAGNGCVDHRLTAFSCWAPFPPRYANSEKFYEIFFDWWTRYVATEPRAYELIPDTTRRSTSPMSGPSSTIALQDTFRLRMKFRFPTSVLPLCVTPQQSFTFLRSCGLVDSGRALVTVVTVSIRVMQCELPKYVCVSCGKKFLMGTHMCVERSRGIFYPTGLSLFWSPHLMDPTGAKKPSWLVTAMQQPDPENVWGIVADSHVERLRNATIARSIVEDRRKVACFGGVVIAAVDFSLADEVQRKFREHVRGPMMVPSVLIFPLNVWSQLLQVRSRP